MMNNQKILEVIEALDRSKNNVPKDWEYLSKDESIMFQVMEMEYNEKPLSDHLGVSKELFPAACDLEDDEIEIIVEKILDTWEVYHFLAHFSEDAPIRKAYEDLLSVWDDIVGCSPCGYLNFTFYEMDLDQYDDTDLDQYVMSDK